MDEHTIEKQKFIYALWYALIITLVLYLVKGAEVLFRADFSEYGIYPLNPKGLRGIFFAPLIHGSWQHLVNNSIPLFVLTLTLFYFYREIALKVFFLVFFVHGFWLWFFGRHSYHIGSSGIVYGLGSFLFVSGIIRKNTHLLAISLLVVFLYGSMVWGIFPMVETVSWEAHLTGLAAGIIFAFFYRQYGPQPNFGHWRYEQDSAGREGNENEEDNYLDDLKRRERSPEE